LILIPETVQNIGLALLGQFVVLMLVVGMSIVASAISVTVILIIIVDIIGVIGWWGISFNPLSAVNLIMAVGLSVEYVAHFVRSFMKHDGNNRKERSTTAILDMGQNVLGGGISTFLGVIVLGFSPYPVFNTYYFRMYFLIIVIGLAHGFFFLPVILSFIGPASFNQHKFTAKVELPIME